MSEYNERSVIYAIDEEYRICVRLLMHTMWMKFTAANDGNPQALTKAEAEAKRGFELLNQARAAMLRVVS